MSGSSDREGKTASTTGRSLSLVGVGVAGAALLGVLLYLFQPWGLWTNSVVNEELPTVTLGSPSSATSAAPSASETNSSTTALATVPSTSAPSTSLTPSATPTTGAGTTRPSNSATPSESPSASSTASASSPAPQGPVVIASGEFRSYEHETTGVAKVVKVGDSYVVRLADFATSNGPDVKVWLTKADVGDADSARRAGYVSLGDLKGNRGNQNYAVPAGTDVADYPTVVIWCDRFSVAFGAAQITKA